MTQTWTCGKCNTQLEKPSAYMTAAAWNSLIDDHVENCEG